MKHIFKMAAVATLALTLFVGCSYPEDNANEGNSSPSGSGNGSSSSGGGGSNNNSNTLKAPTGVTAVGNSSKQITISWNAVASISGYSVSGYNVYRSDNASGPYAKVGTITGVTSYKNSNLAAYTTFYYKVAAHFNYNSSNEGELSTAVSATTFLVAPSGVKATSETSSSITIDWNNLQDATAYRILRSESSGSNYTEIGTSTSNSYTDTGLPTNVRYYYKVSGYNSITDGDESSYVSATTLLKAPTGVTATANSSKEITISWNAVTDASGYYVYRSDDISGPYAQVGSTTGTSYKNSSLSPGTTFYYKVAARNSYTGGEQSTVVSATTL